MIGAGYKIIKCLMKTYLAYLKRTFIRNKHHYLANYIPWLSATRIIVTNAR